MKSSLVPLVLSLVAAVPVAADPVADARAILKEAVEVPTVLGRGQVPLLAAKLRDRLVAAGYAPGDVTIEPVGETAILSAVYRGTGKVRPIAVIGHMDVVEADPKDWTRDPFKLVEENNYLFGRGVVDNKFDVSMLVATLIRLKQEGFKPRRDIILYLSGDEETDGKTARLQAGQAKAAHVEYVLNGDSGGGGLGADGKSTGYSVSGAEKTYADFKLTVTNTGGHSSAPRADNAIYTLARAVGRIEAYKFPTQINPITKLSLADSGKYEAAPLGPALTAFAANPDDTAAAAIISADPSWVGQIRTTCVATQLSAGHAPNALPQRATANINCRIFPGTPIPAVMARLGEVVADPLVKIAQDGDFPGSDASPLRPDVFGAVETAVHARFPGSSVVPGMDSGASDSTFYRAIGIPSYGVSSLFTKSGETNIHGLNEKVPASAIAPALTYWHSVLTTLAR